LVQILVHGGYRNDAITTACSVVNTEQWKWFQPRMRDGSAVPAARTGHSLVAIRENIFLFGGLTEKGLSNELWVLDLDTLTWSQVPTFGVLPSARKGATLVASENGRKMYLFGGHDGSATLNDIHVLEVERFSWAVLGMIGQAPEGREAAAASVIGSLIVIAGGRSLLEDGTCKVANDFWVAHLVKCVAPLPACVWCPLTQYFCMHAEDLEDGHALHVIRLDIVCGRWPCHT
jgi:hypothetical protein